MPVDTLETQKTTITAYHGEPEGGLGLATIEAATAEATVTQPILSA